MAVKIVAALKDIDRRPLPSFAEGLDTPAQPRGSGYFFLIATVALVSTVAPLNSTMIAPPFAMLLIGGVLTVLAATRVHRLAREVAATGEPRGDEASALPEVG